MNVKLLIVQGKPAGKCLLFSRGEFYIGRGPECHVRLNSEWISRQHCLLRITDEAVFLRDLGSRNGTLVNGTLLEGERCLNPSDQVQLGPLAFEVQFERTIPPPETMNRQGDPTAEIKARPANEIEIETDDSVSMTPHEPPVK